MSRIGRFTSGLRKLAYSTFFEAASSTAPAARSYIWAPAEDARRTHDSFSREHMMGLSRYLSANLGVVRGLFNEISMYSAIGQPQFKSSSEAFNDDAEGFFGEWAKIPEVTGRFNAEQLQHLETVSGLRDGDMGYVLTDSPFPQLQSIEGHRMGDGGKADTFDGVKVNEVGRVVAYRVLEGEKRTPRDIPVASFIHVFDPDRLSGYRGISALQAGINHARDISDVMILLKQVVKNESAIAVIRKNKQGEADPNVWNTTTNTDTATTGQILQKIYGGQIPWLAEGEEIQSFATDRPNHNVEQFLQFLIRDISTGAFWPYEFFWDASKLAGTASRLVLVKAQRAAKRLQDQKIRRWTRIAGWVVAKGAKRGDIGTLPADWFKITWQLPAFPTVDVGREAAQDRADFQAGLISPADYFARLGMDVDDVIQTRLAWAMKLKEAAEKANVPLWMMYQATANGNPQEAQVQEEVVDQKDEEENQNGK